jgi:hypothetical protein
MLNLHPVAFNASICSTVNNCRYRHLPVAFWALPIAFARHDSTPLAETRGVVMNLGRVEFEPVELNPSTLAPRSRGPHLPVAFGALPIPLARRSHPCNVPCNRAGEPWIPRSVSPSAHRNPSRSRFARRQISIMLARRVARGAKTPPPLGEPGWSPGIAKERFAWTLYTCVLTRQAVN